MSVTVLLILVISIAFAEFPKLDPNKFTICAITINSDNERKVFEDQVKKNPKKFNPIVELTNNGEYNWFSKACESRIKCDQLLISGHYGGTFFGSSGLSLSSSELESKGCSKTCEGILSHPYEVFLLGCNTLAKKDKDFRTPKEYLKVLLDDGIPRRDAEIVTESRYGPVGDDNRSMMQRAFGGEKKQLYGFHSSGPSGKNIESFLKGYLKKTPLDSRLEKLQAERIMNKVSFANNELKDALKSTAFSQCGSGINENNEKTRIICGLRDNNKPIMERLLILRDAIASDNFLLFVPSVNDFLSQLYPSLMDNEEKKVLAEISNSEVIKKQIMNLLSISTSPFLMNEWRKLAISLGVIKVNEHQEKLLAEIKKLFKKGLTSEDSNLICSLDFLKGTEFGLKGSDLPENFTYDDYRAFNCIQPKDESIYRKMTESLANSVAKMSAQGSETQLKGTQLRFLEEIKKLPPVKKVEAFGQVALLDLSDREIQSKLLDSLNDPTEIVRGKISYLVGTARPQDKEVQLKFLEGLKDQSLYVRQNIVSAFTAIKSQDREVQLKLLDGLRDNSFFIRRNTAHAFYRILPQDKEIQIKLLQFLKEDSDPEVKNSIRGIFTSVKLKDEEVLNRIKEVDPWLFRQIVKN